MAGRQAQREIMLRIFGLPATLLLMAMAVDSLEVQEVRCAASGTCRVLRHHSPRDTLRFERDDGWFAVFVAGRHPSLFLSQRERKPLYLVADPEAEAFADRYNAWARARAAAPFHAELRHPVSETGVFSVFSLLFLFVAVAAWLPDRKP